MFEARSLVRTVAAAAMAAVAVALGLLVLLGMATGLDRVTDGGGSVTLGSVVAQELLGAATLAALGGVVILVTRRWRQGGLVAPLLLLAGAMLLFSVWGLSRLVPYSD